MKKIIKHVEYLKNIDDEILFDIMFSLKVKNFEQDTIVIAEESIATSLYFVEQGCLEVYTNFDPTFKYDNDEAPEFVIERLYAGSAVNHRAYFMQDLMYVNIRCTKQARLL